MTDYENVVCKIIETRLEKQNKRKLGVRNQRFFQIMNVMKPETKKKGNGYWGNIKKRELKGF